MTKHIQMSGMTIRVASIVAVLIADLALTACPLDLLLEKCEIKDTADVMFTNTIGATATMNVFWDGSLFASNIADGASTGVFTVPSGVHTVEFRTTGGAPVCSQPVGLDQCTSTNFVCNG